MPVEQKVAMVARRRFTVALCVVVSGCAAITVGVAFIFWPAGCIVGGVCAVAVGALFVDIPEPSGVRRGPPDYNADLMAAGRR